MILIIGILAAIAIPSFLDQRGRQTTPPPSTRTLRPRRRSRPTTTEHSGNYAGRLEKLQEIESFYTLKGNTVNTFVRRQRI